MRNINIFETQMFPYLEGEEIKDSILTLTIQDIKSEELKTHKGNKETKEVLYFLETHKGFVLNKTNAKRIAVLYGSMTADWEGKQITLYTEPVQAFGELHNALRVATHTIKSDSQDANTMSLDKLFNNLNRVERIQGFYTTPDNILICRAEGTLTPEEDDLDGWRVLFVDARDYALDNTRNGLDELEAEAPEILDDPMPQSTAEQAAMDIEDEYPEIFNE